MKRIHKVGLILGALAAVLAFGAHAWAQKGKAGFFRGRIQAHIDSALDAAKATPPQRAAIGAAVDHVFDAFKDGQQNHGAELEEALSLFKADKLDDAAVTAHRARREAEAKKVGDAMVQAIYDTHDALTAPQRQSIVDFVKQQHQQHQGGHGGMREKFMGHMIDSRIDAALDEVKATSAQRATVIAAKDRVLAALQSSRQDPGADFDKALALFASDKIDGTQVEAMRAEHLAKIRKVADTIVQAISDVHASLSAAQRNTLVDWVRTHQHEHHG